MSIILSNSNINVDYKTSNFNIELVKSELNIRNTSYDNYYNNVTTSINSTPPIKPYIYKENDKIYVVETYSYLGVGNQTTYTRVFTQNTLCDILIVGGGGAGGNSMGGGGGAGGVVYTINQTLNAGTYTINVGKGGTGLQLLTDGQGTTGTEQDGKDSFIQLNGTDVSMLMGTTNQNLRGFGGGGGGIYFADATINGRNGGSGGGCSENNPGFGVRTAGSATQGNTLWNGLLYVAGGKAGRQNTTISSDYQGGGGGGAGNINIIDSTNGNDGININISGESIIYAAGGGSGQYQFNLSLTTKGLGGSNGVGGNGRVRGSDAQGYLREATSGRNGTGSGGGGGAYTQDPDLPAGSGGSGIVIIRYIIETLPKIYTASDGITYVVETYEYRGSGNQTSYTKTFSQNTTCDILLVAGGGGGGQQNAGGGGAGGLVLVQNYTANGSFTINVGKGGNGGNGAINIGGNGSVGNNSTFIKSDNSIIITANGGGGGGGGGAFQPITATNGGSGGGGGWSSVNGVQTQQSQSQIGIVAPAILNQFGENGGHGGGDGNS